MKIEAKFPNFRSRVLLGRLARRQPFFPGRPSRLAEGFLSWYERRRLRIDLSQIRVDRPIFLVGLPRSGTTMLQDILCSHPDVAFITNTMNKHLPFLCAAEDIRRRLRLDFETERFLRDGVSISAGSPSDAIGFWGKWFKDDAFSLEYKALSETDFRPTDLEQIHRVIRRVIWCFGGAGKRFFSKLLGVLPHLPLIKKIFPDARIIHIVRDARLTANSMLKIYRLLSDQPVRTKGLGQGAGRERQAFVPYPRVPGLAGYAKIYGVDDIRTTAHVWNDAVSFVNEVKDKLPFFIEVRYEDILASPREQVSRLLRFCELPEVDSACSAFWEKVHEVGSRRDSNRYEDFETIENICHDNLVRYGYL